MLVARVLSVDVELEGFPYFNLLPPQAEWLDYGLPEKIVLLFTCVCLCVSVIDIHLSGAVNAATEPPPGSLLRAI